MIMKQNWPSDATYRMSDKIHDIYIIVVDDDGVSNNHNGIGGDLGRFCFWQRFWNEMIPSRGGTIALCY